MRHSALLLSAGALLLSGAAAGYYGARATSEGSARVALLPATGLPGRLPPSTPRDERAGSGARGLDDAVNGLPPALPLAWSELLEPGASLAPSAKIRALAGQRVRLVGFMAEMELPIPGAFYLVPEPVECDEAGGGTADLMPTSVLVLSESARGQVVPHVPGALDVTGVLEVGNQPGPGGRMSALRLRLDHGSASADRAPGASPSDISG